MVNMVSMLQLILLYCVFPTVISSDLICDKQVNKICQTLDEFGNVLHVWGIGEDRIAFKNLSIYQSSLSLNSSNPIRIALHMPLNWLADFCELCPKTFIVPLDEEPEVIADRLLSKIIPFIPQELFISKTNLVDLIIEYHVEHYYAIVSVLRNYLEDNNVQLNKMEGGTSSFLSKIKLMRKLSLQSNINTVCEIGFNSGYSSLLWLLSDVEKVISFELGHYSYSSIAINWLHKKFPGKLQVILGDSKITIPTFYKMFPYEKCDLIYIDGGHGYIDVFNDIKNMKFLINFENKNHILLIDDMNQIPVFQAWNEYISNGEVIEHGKISSSFSEFIHSPFTDSMTWTGEKFYEMSTISAWESEMSFGQYIEMN